MGLMGGNIEEAFRHLKGWYRVATKMQAKPCRQMMVGQMDEWVDLCQLVQAVWTTGTIPHQLLWIIVVLIPKGGGDFCGIGLLELIWKVLERIIDLWLALIPFMGVVQTGTVVIEAKLAQQLAYLELQPFY